MRWVTVASAVLAGGLVVTVPFASKQVKASDTYEASSGANCTFSSNPDEFLSAQSRAREDVMSRVRKLSVARLTAGNAAAAAPADIPARTFIDDEIFGRLNKEGIRSAPLSSDEEFVRRIYLDLTGRIPTPDQIREFQANGSDLMTRRDALIDKLVDSPEYVDKWSHWFSEWLQMTANNLSTSTNARQIDGRNAHYNYVRAFVQQNRPVRDLVWEALAAQGNNYSPDTAAVNWIIAARTGGGPIQDSYDMAMSRAASSFLGMGHYDCITCHNGRGHLDQLSSWGKSATRMEAWRMAAFFSRTRWTFRTQLALQYVDPMYNSGDVSNATTGQYDLNVTFGNRPARCANAVAPDPRTGRCLAGGNVTPEYRLNALKPKDGNWRASFADYLTDDPMFARNFVNRVWKQMFNLGLVDPVDTLDPDRLDPKNPPSAPWTLQASHPELLERLAESFRGSHYNFKELVRLIVKSSAYHLSSRYDGEWKLDYVPLFARHYPRRLEAEEIHDAIVLATANYNRYNVQATIHRESATAPVQMLPVPVMFAMQLPDISEPRTNGAVVTFLNNFLRGNRDTQQRSQAGSIIQQLTLMNDPFVMTRVKVAASPTLAAIARMGDNRQIVDELFLTFLSRMPSAHERQVAVSHLAKATSTAAKNLAVEDLAWVAINKVDFLFSY
jgi:hypothetical protein